MSWYVLNLGDAMLALVQEDPVRQQLEMAYQNSGSADNFAAYSRHEADGRLHCEVKIYFSPAAAKTAKKLNARPCRAPSPIGLSLLAGSESALNNLVTEEN